MVNVTLWIQTKASIKNFYFFTFLFSMYCMVDNILLLEFINKKIKLFYDY